MFKYNLIVLSFIIFKINCAPKKKNNSSAVKNYKTNRFAIKNEAYTYIYDVKNYTHLNTHIAIYPPQRSDIVKINNKIQTKSDLSNTINPPTKKLLFQMSDYNNDYNNDLNSIFISRQTDFINMGHTSFYFKIEIKICEIKSVRNICDLKIYSILARSTLSKKESDNYKYKIDTLTLGLFTDANPYLVFNINIMKLDTILCTLVLKLKSSSESESESVELYQKYHVIDPISENWFTKSLQ